MRRYTYLLGAWIVGAWAVSALVACSDDSSAEAAVPTSEHDAGDTVSVGLSDAPDASPAPVDGSAELQQAPSVSTSPSKPSRRAGVTLALPADGHGAHPVAASADYSACS